MCAEFLVLEDICKIQRVCKAISKLLDNKDVWENIFLRYRHSLGNLNETILGYIKKYTRIVHIADFYRNSILLKNMKIYAQHFVIPQDGICLGRELYVRYTKMYYNFRTNQYDNLKIPIVTNTLIVYINKNVYTYHDTSLIKIPKNIIVLDELHILNKTLNMPGCTLTDENKENLLMKKIISQGSMFVLSSVFQFENLEEIVCSELHTDAHDIPKNIKLIDTGYRDPNHHTHSYLIDQGFTCKRNTYKRSEEYLIKNSNE